MHNLKQIIENKRAENRINFLKSESVAGTPNQPIIYDQRFFFRLERSKYNSTTPLCSPHNYCNYYLQQFLHVAVIFREDFSSAVWVFGLRIKPDFL